MAASCLPSRLDSAARKTCAEADEGCEEEEEVRLPLECAVANLSRQATDAEGIGNEELSDLNDEIANTILRTARPAI